MTRIGNVDHVLMLLQQQLQKLKSTERGSRAQRSRKTDNAQAKTSLRRLAAISAQEDVNEQDFERALVRALLVDELGADIADDHRFDRIASEVHRLIASDAKTRELLHHAVGEVTKPQ